MSGSLSRRSILLALLLGLLTLLGACATLPEPVVAGQEMTSVATPPATGPATGSAGRPAPTRALPAVPHAQTLPVQAIRGNATPALIDLTTEPTDLWQRMRNGFGMPDLHAPLVADRQSWYLNRPEMLQQVFARGRRYLFHIVEELDKRGMPTELALLPMVESAFNPHAVSTARAMGLWQFIPSTGKTYNLNQNWWVDERRDILASTDAALTYLQRIYEMHGDWHLALASYNWGENAVGRAITKNQARGLPTDYPSLNMPAETRYYVPKLQALKNIVARPELFGIRLPSIPNQPYFETVIKPERIDVSVAARLAEIPVEEFVSLNPAYHRPVINGDQAGEEMLLPIEKIGTFSANLARYEAQDQPLSNWQTYAMKKGDTLTRVASRHGISEGQLQQINGITPRVKVGPGFALLVPRPGSQAAPESMVRALPKPMPEAAAKKTAPTGKATRRSPAAKQATSSPAGPKADAKAAASKPKPKSKAKASPEKKKT